jgi:hypothetical protein
MDIVIKSFRRPFYLDRLLYSINKFCSGFKNIYISDGGTDILHIEKLNRKYSNLIWDITSSKNSKVQTKDYLSFNNIIKTDIDRLTHWRSTVEKVNTDFFLLIEDDCWLTDRIDLIKYSEMLRVNNAHFSKLWYSSSTDERFSGTSLLLKIHRDPNYPDTLEYLPRLESIYSLYNYFIMGQAIYKKDYYLAGTKNAYVEDETSQLLKAYDFLKNIEGSIPRSFQTYNRIAYQGWAVSIRSDDVFLLESGFSGFNLSDALSDLWLNDDFDANENFPFDFSLSMLLLNFQKMGIDEKIITLYKNWRAGCSINPNNNLL